MDQISSVVMTLFFEIFCMIESLFYAASDLMDPLFSVEKISLSHSHLVLEIIGPKVGLICYPNQQTL